MLWYNKTKEGIRELLLHRKVHFSTFSAGEKIKYLSIISLFFMFDSMTVTKKPEFHWSSMETSLIFSAFSIGHAFSFFGGFVVLKLGGVNTLGIGIGLIAVLSMLFPLFLRVHFLMFVCGRILQGLVQVRIW